MCYDVIFFTELTMIMKRVEEFLDKHCIAKSDGLLRYDSGFWEAVFVIQETYL